MSGSRATKHYAHTRKDHSEPDWEPLEKHLREVSELAGYFTNAFGSKEWGELAGLWHDLGKYHSRFQARLRNETIRQPHAGAGAALAAERDSLDYGRQHSPLAYVIAGHHAGLANGVESGEGFPMPLRERLRQARENELANSLPSAPESIANKTVPRLPDWLFTDRSSRETVKFRLEMWTRFLFSALVDADRLATESFCNPDKAIWRGGSYDKIPVLRARLEARLSELEDGLTDEQRARPINKSRSAISSACARTAKKTPGLFSLTVPTGGGKTLAAMRFALGHAERHDLRRVIVVIPFTSIIEQNAARYAEVLGHENVIEHHSNLDPQRSRDAIGEELTTRHELAAENWEAPIIVTTTVQFFESLFTNRPSRARKLHNIARSVVILDEVQSLPVEYLLTILDGLKQLSGHYGCSIVLSTATPPALKRRHSLPQGLTGVREIVDDPCALAETLRRVTYEWPNVDDPPAEWPTLAEELARERQVLAVVHRRADARELAELLTVRTDNESVFHLSTLMCPAHRTAVLDYVRAALKDGRLCRLVSTQLIEAGVDVDFPVVYRALAGLDAVVQAAGRCNREGRSVKGRVVVFRAPTQPPPGALKRGFDTAVTMLRDEDGLDADDPETQERYFRQVYMTDKDTKNIQRERLQWNFATVGRDFRLIEDGFTHPVIIPWDEGAARLEKLKRALEYGHASRDDFRALQPYTVSVYEKSFMTALESGALEEVVEGLHALKTSHMNHYKEKHGLVIGDDIVVADAASTIL